MSIATVKADSRKNRAARDTQRGDDTMEKRIEAEKLMSSLDTVLEEIAAAGVVYLVRSSPEGIDPIEGFVLGPEQVCMRVLGLGLCSFREPV